AENCPGNLKERLGLHGKIRLDLLTAGNRERRGRLQIRHARIESRSKPAQAGGTPRKGRERTGKIRSGHEQVLSRHQVRHSKLTILVRADLTSQVPALAAFVNVLLENANRGVFDGFSLRAYDVTNNRALGNEFQHDRGGVGAQVDQLVMRKIGMQLKLVEEARLSDAENDFRFGQGGELESTLCVAKDRYWIASRRGTRLHQGASNWLSADGIHHCAAQAVGRGRCTDGARDIG